MIDLWLAERTAWSIAKAMGLPSIQAVEAALRKLAIGYPPDGDRFAVPSHGVRRSGLPFTKRERWIIDHWYRVQSEFNTPDMVAYYERHPRTRNWKRPTPTYLCELLKRKEDELRDFVFANHLRAGLIEALRCPVPEWNMPPPK